MMRTTRLVAPLLTLLLAGACVVEVGDEGPVDGEPYGVDAPPPEMNVHERYQWYVSCGIDPCDPPPDPWHPFVKFGYCSAQSAAE